MKPNHTPKRARTQRRRLPYRPYPLVLHCGVILSDRDFARELFDKFMQTVKDKPTPDKP